MKYLIANWKQNMLAKDIPAWVEAFSQNLSKEVSPEVKIIIAPSFPHLLLLEGELSKAGLSGIIEIGSQDVSPFENGAHTGEVGASQLAGLAKYSIIGHSERRSNGESFEDVNKKISIALKYGISPIVCFSNEAEYAYIVDANKNGLSKLLFLYEPLSAIGSGKPASVEDLVAVHSGYVSQDIIYGGSVDKTNVVNYLNQSFVKGIGVGTASLDPVGFSEIANIL